MEVSVHVSDTWLAAQAATRDPRPSVGRRSLLRRPAAECLGRRAGRTSLAITRSRRCPSRLPGGYPQQTDPPGQPGLQAHRRVDLLGRRRHRASTTWTATAWPTTCASSTPGPTRSWSRRRPGKGRTATRRSCSTRRRCRWTPRWRRWAAPRATSTRTAGWTCWSTTGAARRSLFLAKAGRDRRCPADAYHAGRARRPGVAGRRRYHGPLWNTNAVDGRRLRRRRPRRHLHRQLLPATARCSTRHASTAASTMNHSMSNGHQRRRGPHPALAGTAPPAPGPTRTFERRRRRPCRRMSRTAGPSAPAPPTSTATCCPSCTSPTTSAPTACCYNLSTPGNDPVRR